MITQQILSVNKLQHSGLFSSSQLNETTILVVSHSHFIVLSETGCKLIHQTDSSITVIKYVSNLESLESRKESGHLQSYERV